MLSGILGVSELIILFVLLAVLVIPAVFIYRYGKFKGRLEEMEKRRNQQK